MESPKVYKAKIDLDGETGVSLISIVSSPAIESNFIALNSDVMSVKLATDKMKQVVTGAVLIPGKLIPRTDEAGNLYYLTFDAEDVEAISQKFFKQGFIDKTNDEHSIPLSSNYIVESWIVKDSEKDKSIALGLDKLPVGSWVVSYKIEDKQYFESEIVSGNRKGFSLEGIFNQEEVKLQSNMSKLQIGRRKKYPLFQKFFEQKKDVELEITTLKDGTPIEIDEETMEVFIIDKSTGSRVGPAPDGDHTLENGQKITVKDGKMIMDQPQNQSADLAKENEALKKQLADLIAAKEGTDLEKEKAAKLAKEEADKAEHKEFMEKFKALSEQVVKLSQASAAVPVEKVIPSTAGLKVNNFQKTLSTLKHLEN